MKLGDGKIEIDEDEGFPYFIIKVSNPMGGANLYQITLDEIRNLRDKLEEIIGEE
jgi:hypothetical protein